MTLDRSGGKHRNSLQRSGGEGRCTKVGDVGVHPIAIMTTIAYCNSNTHYALIPDISRRVSVNIRAAGHVGVTCIGVGAYILCTKCRFE